MESKQNPVYGALTIIGLAGRNKNRQKMVRCKCACGSPEFVTRLDSVKAGRTKSCGHCGYAAPAPAPRQMQPTALPVAQEQVTPPAAPDAQPAQTETWYRAQIAAKEGAALVNEKRANEIEQATIELGADEELNREWNCCSATAKKQRAAAAKLLTELERMLTAQAKPTDPANANRDRIAQLRAQRGGRA